MPQSKEEKAAYQAAYYQRNREKKLARAALDYANNPGRKQEANRRYYATHQEQERARTAQKVLANPEQKRAWDTAYQAKHREEKRQRDSAYHAKHAEKRRAYQRRYKARYPAVTRSADARRRAAQRIAPRNDFTHAQWQEMLAHYRHTCAYCGHPSRRLTRDHLTPLLLGGSHTLWNIVPACNACNSRKHTGAVLCAVQPMLLTLAPAKTYAGIP